MVATQLDRGWAVTSAEGPLLGDAAVFDDDQLVGQRGRFDGVVGHQQPRAGVATELAAQHPAQLGPGGGVDRGEGFVEEEHARLGGQRPGQGDPLGLAA